MARKPPSRPGKTARFTLSDGDIVSKSSLHRPVPVRGTDADRVAQPVDDDAVSSSDGGRVSPKRPSPGAETD
jgi:hypothetical protein